MESILFLQALAYKSRSARIYTRITFVIAGTSIMSTTHATQYHSIRDLTFILKDLDDRADRILTSLYLLWQLDEGFAEIQKGLEQQDYIDLIRSNVKKMEADLEVIQRKSELLNDDRLCDWIDEGTDETEKA